MNPRSKESIKSVPAQANIVNFPETEPDDKPRQAPLGLAQMEFAFMAAGLNGQPNTYNFLTEEKFPTQSVGT
jgi:hypothetical protein